MKFEAFFLSALIWAATTVVSSGASAMLPSAVVPPCGFATKVDDTVVPMDPKVFKITDYEIAVGEKGPVRGLIPIDPDSPQGAKIKIACPESFKPVFWNGTWCPGQVCAQVVRSYLMCASFQPLSPDPKDPKKFQVPHCVHPSKKTISCPFGWTQKSEYCSGAPLANREVSDIGAPKDAVKILLSAGEEGADGSSGKKRRKKGQK